MRVWPGTPYPLGASYDGRGTNFSLFSEAAERVELCLFGTDGTETRIEFTEVTGHCWHCYLPEVEPGQLYGYRVHGPWAPEEGRRCNPAKLLMDPYTKIIHGDVTWDDAVFPYALNDGPNTRSDTDSAPFVPRCAVHQPYFDWGGDRQLQVPLNDSIIYETHVKSFTARMPGVPEDLRGTYAGMGHPAAVQYLKRLGITAVELMPVHQFVHDKHLIDRGLRNFWGYNTLSYLAPHPEYASDKRPLVAVAEFKQMVKALHQEGIEVILDVVYNHSAEGNHLGPMLSFKGIDNAYYYRLTEDKQFYMDYTGTGNTFDMRQPHVLQLLMDSLRYWVLEMHVDGFRFDLAAALARALHEVDRLSAFFDVIQQDPVISQVKLIAEPWDVGEGGYQVGNFPPVWAEWNGRYRDCVRDLWRGKPQTLAEFASRFTGSSDLYESTTRRPFASVNFITAHDGFTLNDLVSYNEKHNEANGEENRDGESHNRSWNCGAEGPTDDAKVHELRARQKRNFLATLLLSQGVPMILGGDEFGRTQRGNNNAYCQDNEISWYDWVNQDRDLHDFCETLIQYRKQHPVFRRRDWFEGTSIRGSDTSDIAWFTQDGQHMTDEYWEQGHAKSLGIYLNGKTIPNPNVRSEATVDDDFYIILNAHNESLKFVLPEQGETKIWKKELDTVVGWLEPVEEVKPGEFLEVGAHALVVLRHGS